MKPYAKPIVCSVCRWVMKEYPGLRTPPVFLAIERAWLCHPCWERALPESAARWAAIFGRAA